MSGTGRFFHVFLSYSEFVGKSRSGVPAIDQRHRPLSVGLCPYEIELIRHSLLIDVIYPTIFGDIIVSVVVSVQQYGFQYINPSCPTKCC